MLSHMTTKTKRKSKSKPANPIKVARLLQGLTQENLATTARVCVRCVTRAEQRGKLPYSIEGVRLAKVLGLAEPVRNYLKRGPMAV
jgi:DNA-binding transcriptional regulator YiaG